MLLLAWREATDNHDAAQALDDIYHTGRSARCVHTFQARTVSPGRSSPAHSDQRAGYLRGVGTQHRKEISCVAPWQREAPPYDCWSAANGTTRYTRSTTTSRRNMSSLQCNREGLLPVERLWGSL